MRDGYSTAGSAGTGLGALSRLAEGLRHAHRPRRGDGHRGAAVGRAARPAWSAPRGSRPSGSRSRSPARRSAATRGRGWIVTGGRAIPRRRRARPRRGRGEGVAPGGRALRRAPRGRSRGGDRAPPRRAPAHPGRGGGGRRDRPRARARVLRGRRQHRGRGRDGGRRAQHGLAQRHARARRAEDRRVHVPVRAGTRCSCSTPTACRAAGTWTPIPGLAARQPGVIAGVLYRDFRRERDDATIVVARVSRAEATRA